MVKRGRLEGKRGKFEKTERGGGLNMLKTAITRERVCPGRLVSI